MVRRQQGMLRDARVDAEGQRGTIRGWGGDNDGCQVNRGGRQGTPREEVGDVREWGIQRFMQDESKHLLVRWQLAAGNEAGCLSLWSLSFACVSPSFAL